MSSNLLIRDKNRYGQGLNRQTPLDLRSFTSALSNVFVGAVD